MIISGLILHSITSYLVWCNSAGTACEKHWYNREKTRACVLCGGGSADNSVAFCLRQKNVVSREGQRGLSMILQTLLWQDKLGKQRAKCETVHRAVTWSLSLLQGESKPLSLATTVPMSGWVSPPFLRLQQPLQLASFDCPYLLKQGWASPHTSSRCRSECLTSGCVLVQSGFDLFCLENPLRPEGCLWELS